MLYFQCMKTILTIAILVFASISSFGQTSASTSNAADKFALENELAKKVIAAHGGDKFTGMKSLVVNGSADFTSSNFPQAIPATFIMIFAGDKYRIELNNPFQPLKQAFDGTKTSSTAPGGFSLPPINKLGIPLLAKVGTFGYVVTPLPAGKKKKNGFRVTSPEAYATDFYIDAKTNLVSGYEATYLIDGRTVTTSVEIDKTKVVDGVTVPEKYVQRFDLSQFTVYASFKAKEITVNTAVADDVFAVGN
jgi:hypothetical protein